MNRINVTKTYLPPKDDYLSYVDQIWDSAWLTNQGPLVLRLEEELRQYLGVKHVHLTTNGTLALQIALRALDCVGGEIITTPFSYVATTSSILWEHCTPVFVDIDPDSLCMDPQLIELAITPRTKAIMPVHVFGRPCDVDAIQDIASKHDIKVIYDAAHGFGGRYKGKSLLGFGDISMGSFHATKLFHTIEGGCLATDNNKLSEAIDLLKRFGHTGDDHYRLGMNAKASEFQAAMGLSILPHVPDIIEERKSLSGLYDKLLAGAYKPFQMPKGVEYNYAYYPLVLESEEELKRVVELLAKQNIYPRRYFYPSLNTLPYIKNAQSCPVSEDIANRILCLPLYNGLEEKTVHTICDSIRK